MAINLFDFSQKQSKMIQPGTFQEYLANRPAQQMQSTQPTQQPTTPTSGGFSVIPKANASESKMSIEEFGNMIKKKYPDYVEVDSNVLGQKMLQKFPDYNDIVDVNKTTQPVQQEKPGLFQIAKESLPNPKAIGEVGLNVLGGLEKNITGAVNIAASPFGVDPMRTPSETIMGVEQATPSFLERSVNTIGQRGQELGDVITAEGQTQPEAVFQGTMKVARGLLDIGGDAFMSALSTASTQDQKEFAKQELQKAIETKGGQWVMNKMQEAQRDMETLRELDPRAARNFEAVFTLLEGAGEAVGLSTGKRIAKAGVETLENIPTQVPEGVRQAGQTVLEQGGKVVENISEKMKNVKVNNATKQIEKGEDILFEAVNPTTRENKAVLRQRVQDLLPYIDNNPLKNSLEDVKSRIDSVKLNAGKMMEDYESNIGVKGNVETAPIIKKLKEKYQEKIGDSFINADEAKMSQQLIDTLKGFGDNVTDADIIKIRRAWDKIIEKNKGFMQSADANSKGDIFADANRFFREEIKKSNPDYAKYLNDYHKSTTLSDVLDATIQRRVGQQKGGFLKRGLEIGARVTGAGTGGLPGYLATEALIQGANVLSGPGFKLTRGAKLLKKGNKNLKSNKTKNGVDNNDSSSVNNNSVGRGLDKNVILKPKKSFKELTGKTLPKETPKKETKSVLSEREKAKISTKPKVKDKTPLPKKSEVKGNNQTKKEATKKKPELSYKGGVKTISPEFQHKFNQGADYEAVRVISNPVDSKIIRYGALENKLKQSVIGKGPKLTEAERLELKSIEKELKMSREDIMKRSNEIKEMAKSVRSKDDQVILDLNSPKAQLETTLKGATTSNINEITKSVAKTLKTTKTAEIKTIIQRYLKEFGKDFKNKIGDLIEEIAEKVGAKINLVSSKDGIGVEKTKMLNQEGQLERLNPMSKNKYTSGDFKSLSDLDSDDLFRAIGTRDWENIPKQVTLYRGIKSNKDFDLFPGDFLTKNKKIAENFAGPNGKVKSFKVNTKDLKGSDFGYEEVVYQPNNKPKLLKKSK